MNEKHKNLVEKNSIIHTLQKEETQFAQQLTSKIMETQFLSDTFRKLNIELQKIKEVWFDEQK